MLERLRALRSKGFIPDTVLDIGAYHGTWTAECRLVYPEANYYLYEGIEYPELDRFRTLEYSNTIKVFSGTILNDKETDIVWYQQKNTGDSMFRERTHYFENCEKVIRSTTTLDRHLVEQQGMNPSSMGKILIKIDTQGSEIPILKGGMRVVEKADFILLEVPFFGEYNKDVPGFRAHLEFMESIGFIPFDLFERHEMKGYNVQVDILFIHKNHEWNETVKKDLLNPWI